MASDYNQIEKTIDEATDALEREPNLKIRATGRAFNISYSRPYAHYCHGRASQLTRPRTNMRLSDIQELALCQ